MHLFHHYLKTNKEFQEHLRNSTHLSRLGAQTRARFRVCMLVYVLKVARWAKCFVRYSRVLQRVNRHLLSHLLHLCWQIISCRVVSLWNDEDHLKWGVGSSLMTLWMCKSLSWFPWTETTSCTSEESTNRSEFKNWFKSQLWSDFFKLVVTAAEI